MAAVRQSSSGLIKMVDGLQGDLRNLASECKRKHPMVKEGSEAAMMRLRNIVDKGGDIQAGMLTNSMEIVNPFVLGCDTKNTKVVPMCLSALQKLIQFETVSLLAADAIINSLWMLMGAQMEELKLLQTAMLLITVNAKVQRESLARALVLCFRLHFTKDSVTINTAAAAICGLVRDVFERVVIEDGQSGATSAVPSETASEDGREELSGPSSISSTASMSRELQPCAFDAYMMFQDFCRLVNGDNPIWLVGMTEMTRTFGLELIELTVTSFPQIFYKHAEFAALLKDRVCPLVIKLFSPSIKYRIGATATLTTPAAAAAEKPFFPIVVHLLRLVQVLVQFYHEHLITECEIFMSLLVKFLDPEKPVWLRAAVIEVLGKLCSKPKLIWKFCENYDMKEHSTKIFQEIVNSLSSFVQSQFIGGATSTLTPSGGKAGDTQSQPPALVAGLPVGGGATAQPAFTFHNVWLPILVNLNAPTSINRQSLLEMTEKTEAPSIPDGYSLSYAFLALVDTAKSVQTIVEGPLELNKVNSATSSVTSSSSLSGDPRGVDKRQLCVELVNSSWCGMLAASTLLLEASTDEMATEWLLKLEQSYASMAGQLELLAVRDAFVTALCKASLPPHYTLTVIATAGKGQTNMGRTNSTESASSLMSLSSADVSSNSSQQVVAMATPLPTFSQSTNSQQGAAVVLTSKNIHCMRSLLNLAHCHGAVLGTSWHLVLTTLQHLAWILGLKPSVGGTLKTTQSVPDTVITTAVMAELPVLSGMLSRLFESSQYLNDVAVHHLIDALVKLSTESMEIAQNNKEPSLFSVAKLLETGLVNLSRVEILWRPVTGHLLEVCSQGHAGLRQLAADAVVALVKASLEYKYDPPLKQQPKLLAMLVAPLSELSSVSQSDVRQRQLDCVLSVLHGSGDILNGSWTAILNILAAATADLGEALMRLAFQSLQLIVADFLPTMPCTCLQLCIDVTAKFGQQLAELNVSLSAIVLMWNIADFLSHNRARITSELTAAGSEAAPYFPDLPPVESLWLFLFLRLRELCVDSRPAVRKSASQTLFSMVDMHSSHMANTTWHGFIWKVLFPLQEQVKQLSGQASSSKEPTAVANILIHHSRDTEEKQWAETRVLTLAGVARVFSTKGRRLCQLPEFLRAWILLLEHIESAALCANTEVSLAALKSFQDVLLIGSSRTTTKTDTAVTKPDTTVTKADTAATKPVITPAANPSSTVSPMTKQPTSVTATQVESNKKIAEPSASGGGGVDNSADSLPAIDGALFQTLMTHAWQKWLAIGTFVTSWLVAKKDADAPPPSNNNGLATTTQHPPSQAFLTSLMQTFPLLFVNIKSRFVADDLRQLSTILQRVLVVPVSTDSTPFLLPVGVEAEVTPLQQALLGAFNALEKEMAATESMQSMYVSYFELLLSFVEYGVQPPGIKPEQRRVEPVIVDKAAIKPTPKADWIAMNYVPFAESVTRSVSGLYKAVYKHPVVTKGCVLEKILRAFHLPLSVRYGCPSQSTWKLVISCLTAILKVAIPEAVKNEKLYQGMWSELGVVLHDFLFPQQSIPWNLSVDQFREVEDIDCQIVIFIRDEILPHSKVLPSAFINKIIATINEGSIHSLAGRPVVDIETRMREEFAKLCFDTLLQFSFSTTQAQSTPTTPSTGAAKPADTAMSVMSMKSLVTRCHDVLTTYAFDERMAGGCPLPRMRRTEMLGVLKAITSLVTKLKTSPSGSVDEQLWKETLAVYPALVECVTCQSDDVVRLVKEALLSYADCLRPVSVGTRVVNGS